MKCENPNCNNNAIKQYKSGWCCSTHCALALAAKHSSQVAKENYNGHHKCSKCNCEFKTKKELHQHKIDVHYGNEVFKCICGKEFHSKHSLGSHKQQCNEWLKQNGKLLVQYICNGCKREFKSKASLTAHIVHCEKYIKTSINGLHTSKYWHEDKQTYICECGKEFDKHQSLNAHFSMCKTHKIAIGKEPKIAESKIRRGEKCSFSKGYMSKEKYDVMHRRSGKTIKHRIKTGEIVHSWLGKHHSEETKRKIRQSTVKYLVNVVGSRPRYNKSAICILEQIAKEHGWNIQHAENGGEFYTGIGYFVDAYDKEKNIVLEYDEKHHYEDVENNILKEKDLKRQNEIIEYLHCEYWRYNETTKCLWKVC